MPKKIGNAGWVDYFLRYEIFPFSYPMNKRINSNPPPTKKNKTGLTWITINTAPSRSNDLQITPANFLLREKIPCHVIAAKIKTLPLKT